MTSHFQEGIPEYPPEWIAMEYADGAGDQLTNVARSASGISTLYETTGGNPSSNPRWHANMSYGADQEMIAAVRTRSGDVWGALGLYREPDRPLFDADEKAFLVAISPLMADAVRRALLIGEECDDAGGIGEHVLPEPIAEMCEHNGRIHKEIIELHDVLRRLV